MHSLGCWVFRRLLLRLKDVFFCDGAVAAAAVRLRARRRANGGRAPLVEDTTARRTHKTQARAPGRIPFLPIAKLRTRFISPPRT
jgi:hypothetical protein